MGKENTTYRNYATYIFSYFKNCTAPGQGLYLFRSMQAKTEKEGKTRTEINHINIVAFNLYENGYITEPDESMPFIKLTEKGFNCISGDSPIIAAIELEHYIDITKNDIDLVFRQLWDIIGKENEAPFYVNGTIYFNAIYPYIKGLSGNYSTFMENLKQKGLSTSRVVWFKELLKQVDFGEIAQFLYDLSIGINKYYEVNEEDDNWDDILNQSYSSSENTILESKTTIKDTVSSSIKKTVFITYCWEDSVHTSWVHQLSNDLQDAGFNVIIDVEQPLGIELNQFMEQTITKADKILIIATPEYKDRADNRKYGVGYETSLITADLIKDQNKIKFIPIIRKGSKDDCYPTYLGNRKGLPMTEKDDCAKALKELIENIKNY